MARYSLEHKEETHLRIVTTAASLFRKQGYKATRIDAIMKLAGLTSGGFYAHFNSKEQLFTEALILAAQEPRKLYYEGIETSKGVSWLKKIVKRYLNLSHRDNLTEGCPFPALLSEFPHLSNEAKEKVEQELKKSIEVLVEKMPKYSDLDTYDRVLATLSLFVGSLSLSRSVKSEKLSRQILKASQKFALPEIYHQESKGKPHV